MQIPVEAMADGQAPVAVLGAPSPRLLWLAWLLCLIPLFLFVGSTTCTRTQEARVLESAREIASGSSPWLLPHCNRVMRLQKPPLAYWMAAAAFRLGGVSEWAGRAPTVLVTWLTLGLFLHVASTLFGARAGLLTLAVMLASYGMFRFGRLAETDAPAAFGVALATWSFWRAAEADAFPRKLAWHWLAGTAMAFALMSKGPPAVFPLLFLLIWCGLNRTPRYLWDFIRSGGLLVFIVLGLSWYAYLWHSQGLNVIRRELQVVTDGEDHPGPFYFYTYSLLQVAIPWCALAIAGVVESVRQCRRDRRLLGLVVWLASSLLPLSLTGNKQLHYTMSILPVVLLLTGWIIDRSLREDSPERVRRWGRILLIATFAVSLLFGPALLVARVAAHQPLRWGDAVLAGIAMSAALGALLLARRSRTVAAVLVYSAGIAVLFSAVFSYWGQSLKGSEVGDVAAEIAGEFGRGPYLTWDNRPDLSIIFGMRQFLEATHDQAYVQKWIARHPQGVVLLCGYDDPSKAKLPSWLVPTRRYGVGDSTAWLLRLEPLPQGD